MCPTSLDGRRPNTKYCSPQCASRAQNLADKEAGRPKRGNRETRLAWRRENEANRRDVQSVCARCGEEFLGRRGEKNRFCSRSCTRGSRRVPKPLFRQLEFHFPQPMSPLRLAYESGWNSRVLEILLESTEQLDGGCRLWLRNTDADSYPRISIKGKRVAVHRLVAQMIHGDIGIAPVHHKCGNRLCIAPDHLQVVTPIENTAEMLERRSFRERIAELEAEVARLQASEERRLAS